MSYQTNPAVLTEAMTKTNRPNNIVVKAKLFHHNNLVLQLLRDDEFKIYTINILRINDGTQHDLWGMYDDSDGTGLSRAMTKFNSIQL